MFFTGAAPAVATQSENTIAKTAVFRVFMELPPILSRNSLTPRFLSPFASWSFVATPAVPAMISPSRPDGLETLAHFGNEVPGLLPRSEVAPLGKLVVMDELGVGLLRPALRRRIDLVRECAHGDRDLEAADVEEAPLCHLPGVPVETSRGDRGVRQPVHRDVVEDVVPREAFLLSIEDARDERVAARVVVQDPRGQADGRVHETVERLRPKPHLVGVAQAFLV